MILLGVNIDHCATVRQARYREIPAGGAGNVEPDPVAFAVAAERAGADGITLHLREDRRHVQDRDVWRMRESIATRMNLEMACTAAMTELALKIKPDAVCLVPEHRQEITTEGGLDLAHNRDRVKACVEAMSAANIVTSLFIDPDELQIELAVKLKAPCIELHTGAWANAWHVPGAREKEFARIEKAAAQALAAGLTVNAGHGINYVNVADLRAIPGLHEFNIGHSIVSRALFTGVDEAVREMKNRMNG